MLRRHRGLVLDQGEAEDEEDNVHPGLHRDMARMLLEDDHIQFNYDFQLS